MTDAATEPALRAMIVPVTPIEQNCTIIWCTKTKKGAVIDPGGDLPKIKAAITSDAFKKLIVESTDDGSINRKVLALFRKDFWKDFI